MIKKYQTIALQQVKKSADLYDHALITHYLMVEIEPLQQILLLLILQNEKDTII